MSRICWNIYHRTKEFFNISDKIVRYYLTNTILKENTAALNWQNMAGGGKPNDAKTDGIRSRDKYLDHQTVTAVSWSQDEQQYAKKEAPLVRTF
ncbi:MAG: hypothetical protein ABIN01_13770 [Ferruginibacter sp.]